MFVISESRSNSCDKVTTEKSLVRHASTIYDVLIPASAEYENYFRTFEHFPKRSEFNLKSKEYCWYDSINDYVKQEMLLLHSLVSTLKNKSSNTIGTGSHLPRRNRTSRIPMQYYEYIKCSGDQWRRASPSPSSIVYGLELGPSHTRNITVGRKQQLSSLFRDEKEMSRFLLPRPISTRNAAGKSEKLCYRNVASS
jgi:hypothetical protein